MTGLLIDHRSRTVRYSSCVFALLMLSACAGVLGAGPAKKLQSAHAAMVKIVGNPLGNPDSFYRPTTIHIRVGQTVEWFVKDDSSHTVTPSPSTAGWEGGSDVLHHGKTYSHRFTRQGSYRYTCMVHPNMIGFVIVSR